MRALLLNKLIGPDGLSLEDVPSPVGEGVRVDVHAAVVSFADMLITKGEYQLQTEPPFVPGIEACGVVRSAPSGSGFAPGERVVAFSVHGAFADEVLAPAERVFHLPDNVSFERAAGFAVNYQTAWFTLVRRAGLMAGERVLVQGAGGGVGTAAIEMAKALGAYVVAAASSEAKRAAATRAGADAVIDPTGSWAAQVRDLTDGHGVDVVVDPVGGERFDESIRALALEGRVVVVGFAAGSIPQVKVNRLLLRNVTVMGAAWREFLNRRPEVAPEAAAAVADLMATGRLGSEPGAIYPLERGADALRALADRSATGKLVIAVRS